jgi:hypothetical protein
VGLRGTRLNRMSGNNESWISIARQIQNDGTYSTINAISHRAPWDGWWRRITDSSEW